MMEELTYGVVIPARYRSTRFPGKPLVDICGKPMVQHVWEKCVTAVGSKLVYVATDDDRIAKAVEDFGGQYIMTSAECLTGTDRLAEANVSLKLDFMINVQGDEPMVEPSDIIKVRNAYIENPAYIVNAYAKISEREDPYSTTLPKVVVSKSGNLLYMSRAAIPMNKNGEGENNFKQVCIYAFSKNHLDFFSANPNKTTLESIEDIEILRFLENDMPVKMVEVDNVGMAVDTPADLERVVYRMNNNEA